MDKHPHTKSIYDTFDGQDIALELLSKLAMDSFHESSHAADDHVHCSYSFVLCFQSLFPWFVQ